MAIIRTLALLVLLSGAGAARFHESAAVTANPIRRVVTMLQKMQKKIAAESERDQEIFDKFMCYCKNGAASLEESISAAGSRIPQIQSSLEEATNAKAVLDEELVKHKADRAEAKDAVAQGKELRKKENDAFAKEAAELKTNIAAVGKAVNAVEKGMAGAFVQTKAASRLQSLAVDMDLVPTDRDLVASFLSEGSNGPQSGEIAGVLKQIKETLEGQLKTAQDAEAKSVEAFEDMVKAKKKEIAAASEAIEAKMLRTGELGVQIENMKEDLEDTTASLAEDKKFVGNLASDCEKKEGEWDAIKKTRAQEMQAIAETIKILNDDDALDLFKKTLPTPSLLQITVRSKEMQRAAVRALGRAARDPRLDFISLALQGKKFNFNKVVGMIDKMVALLSKEQTDDDAKKKYCEAEFDTLEDDAKALKIEASDVKKAIKKMEGTMATLAEEIAALSQGIKDLDREVAAAMANRQAEHADFEEDTAANNAAQELLKMAKNRLQKFYNPKLYKAPPEFLQVASKEDDGAAPPPPPEAVGAYQKKGEESAGVLSMIDMLVADLVKEVQEMKVEEEDAQAEYERLCVDSSEKRMADAKSLEEKTAARADLEADLVKAKEESKEKAAEIMAKDKEISKLHGSCDWLLSNYETRSKAREEEVESLKNAKAVLSGADYSLAQTRRSLLHRGRRT